MELHVTVNGFVVIQEGRPVALRRNHRPGIGPQSPRQVAAALSTNRELAKIVEKKLNAGVYAGVIHPSLK